MKIAILQSKEYSFQNIEENRPMLKFNFTLENMCDKSKIDTLDALDDEMTTILNTLRRHSEDTLKTH